VNVTNKLFEVPIMVCEWVDPPSGIKLDVKITKDGMSWAQNRNHIHVVEKV
jgi:hypothetical protein